MQAPSRDAVRGLFRDARVTSQAADDEAQAAAARDLIDQRAERARRKKAAQRLGWKLVGRETAEIRIERQFTIGRRTAIVRGRVPVALPSEMTVEAGELALAPIVDPVVAKFSHAMERAASKILTAPDDGESRHVFDNVSFFTALEEARRGLVREYQELENRRVDERVEADLGLRFYLASFSREKPALAYFAGPTNSGKTHAAIARRCAY
jgi:hypothetical protein